MCVPCALVLYLYKEGDQMTREVVILENKWCFMMGPCVPAQAIMEQICRQKA